MSYWCELANSTVGDTRCKECIGINGIGEYIIPSTAEPISIHDMCGDESHATI